VQAQKLTTQSLEEPVANLTVRTRAGDVMVMRDSHIPLRFRIQVVDIPANVALLYCGERTQIFSNSWRHHQVSESQFTYSPDLDQNIET